METAGACFERCLGQAPAEVLMLGQLEASARCIVAQSKKRQGMSPTGQGMGSNPNAIQGMADLDWSAPINLSRAQP